MTEKNVECIRTAAYYIWEKEGKPEGKDQEIWFRACAEIAKCPKKAEKKAVVKKTTAKIIAKPVNKPIVKKESKPVAKVVAKPVAKVAAKPVAKPAKATLLKPALSVSAKKASCKKVAKKCETNAKIKYNPIPVKTTTPRIITPLYGSIKK